MYLRQKTYIQADFEALVNPVGVRDTEWMLIDSLYGSVAVSLPPFEAISFDLGDLWPPRTVQIAVPSNPTVEPAPELIETSK